MTSRTKDVRSGDIALAGALAVVVLLGSVMALETSRLRRRADAPIIDPGIATPVRVRPVLETETPSGAETIEKVSEAQLPPRWSRSEARRGGPKRARSKQPTRAKAKQRAKSKSTQRAKGQGSPTDPETPPAPDEDEEEEELVASAGAPEVDAPPAGDVPGEPAPAEPSPAGEADSGLPAPGDRLGQRAVAAYRERLIRWFSLRFRVRGSGLPRAELLRQRARATVELDADGVVLRYTITPGAHKAFDAAARAALDAVIGETVPSPPEQYPGALQRRLTVTFVCTEATCD